MLVGGTSRETRTDVDRELEVCEEVESAKSKCIPCDSHRLLLCITTRTMGGQA